MVRFAEYRDFPALMSMWRSCFNDSAKATELIFSKLQKPENMLVLVENKKIAAMLSIRSFTLTSPDTGRPAAYIYGVATSPDEQGKGYSTALLDETHRLLSKRGAVCSALVPANEGLFEFYKKRGYEPAFNINRVAVDANGIATVEMRDCKPVTAERFAVLRDAHFSDSRMFACFPEEYLSYIIEESKFYGGGAFEFSVAGKPCLAVFHRFGDEITVRELAVEHGGVDEAIAMIKARFPAKRYVFRLREDVQTSYTNNLLPFGMLKWYDNNAKIMENTVGMDKAEGARPGRGAPAYLAHALD